MKTSHDIVKASEAIKDSLKQRFKELDLSYSYLIADAEKYGRKLDKGNLSRYLNKPYPVKPCLTQEQILWLCIRYEVPITLLVGNFEQKEVQVQGNSIKALIRTPMPKYDEIRAIDRLKKVFK